MKHAPILILSAIIFALLIASFVWATGPATDRPNRHAQIAQALGE